MFYKYLEKDIENQVQRQKGIKPQMQQLQQQQIASHPTPKVNKWERSFEKRYNPGSLGKYSFYTDEDLKKATWEDKVKVGAAAAAPVFLYGAAKGGIALPKAMSKYRTSELLAKSTKAATGIDAGKVKIARDAFFRPAVDSIKTVSGKAFGGVKHYANKGGAAVNTFFRPAVNSIKNMSRKAFGGVKHYANKGGEGIKAAPKKVWNEAEKGFESLIKVKPKVKINMFKKHGIDMGSWPKV